MKKIFSSFPVLFLFMTACASVFNKHGGVFRAPVDSQLKVSSGIGHLKAKLMLKNTGSNEFVINDLSVRGFKVETVDGKSMPFKGQGAPAGESLRLKPGESAESAFSLQEYYPFWDRRTKYKIWYESSELKSNVVQVWF